jgi:hypothetical protein
MCFANAKHIRGRKAALSEAERDLYYRHPRKGVSTTTAPAGYGNLPKRDREGHDFNRAVNFENAPALQRLR